LDKIKNEKTSILILAMLIIVILIATFVFSILLGRKEEVFEFSDNALGVDVKQTIYGYDSSRAAKRVMRQIKKLEKQISWKINNSQVSKINENAGDKWVDLSSGMLDILSKSLDVANSSNGAFDPTIFPISSTWDPDKKLDFQNNEELKSKLSLIDYKFLKINRDVKRAKLFKQNAGLDLDGICKGSACNFAMREYKEEGIPAAIVSVGRSIGIYGNKKDGPWKIGLKDPFDNSDSKSFAVLETQENHIFISGSNKKSIEPNLAYSKDNNISSVTVIHKDGIIADALAIACHISGMEKSLPLLKHYEAKAIFIDNQKKVFTTDNLKEQIKIRDSQFVLL
jgi:thiamine biosynthesis lipoprotein